MFGKFGENEKEEKEQIMVGDNFGTYNYLFIISLFAFGYRDNKEGKSSQLGRMFFFFAM